MRNNEGRSLFGLCLSLLNPESTTQPTLAIHPGYSCQRLTTAASLVFLFHTPSPRRSANVSFVFFRVFFYPVIIIKTIFFREVPEVFTVYFHREWDIFIGKTARHPRYCSALIYFFPFFRPLYIFWNLRIPSKRICYIAISFARILYNAGKTTWMNNVSSFFHIIVSRFRIFLPSFSFQISSYSVNFPESRHAKFDSLFISLLINNIWREKSISRFNKLSSSERVNNEKSDFVIYLATWWG